MNRISITSFILAIALAGSALAFKPLDSSFKASNNFVLSSLLEIDNNDTYILTMMRDFERICLALPLSNDVTSLLVNIAQAPAEKHKADSPIQALLKAGRTLEGDLVYLFGVYLEVIKLNFQNTGIEWVVTSMEEFNKNLSGVFRNYLADKIVEAINTNKELIVDSEEEQTAISKAVEEFARTSQESGLVDVENFKAYVEESWRTNISDTEDIISDYFAFRADAVTLISKFADTIMNGILDGKVEWNQDTVKQFETLFKAIIAIQRKNGIIGLEPIFQFAENTLIPSIKILEKEKFQVMSQMVFDLFADKYSNQNCVRGVEVALKYIFSSDYKPSASSNRRTVHQHMYKSLIRVYGTDRTYLKFDKLINLVFNADMLWTGNGCNISELDFKLFMTNINQYYEFDTSYLHFIDQGDRYFADHDHVIRDHLEIYAALYNVVMRMSIQIKDRNSYLGPDKKFEDAFEAFITSLKIFDQRFERFDVNIREFYTVFKLINLGNNLIHFADRDDNFLFYDEPKSPETERFVASYKPLEMFLNKWKQEQVPSEYNDYTLLLNGQSISKVFTRKFFNEYVAYRNKIKV